MVCPVPAASRVFRFSHKRNGLPARPGRAPLSTYERQKHHYLSDSDCLCPQRLGLCALRRADRRVLSADASTAGLLVGYRGRHYRDRAIRTVLLFLVLPDFGSCPRHGSLSDLLSWHPALDFHRHPLCFLLSHHGHWGG